MIDAAQALLMAIQGLPNHTFKPRNKGYFKSTCYECHGTMYRVYGGDVRDCSTCNGSGFVPSGDRVVDHKLLGQMLANALYGDELEPLSDGTPIECALAVESLVKAIDRLNQFAYPESEHELGQSDNEPF